MRLGFNPPKLQNKENQMPNYTPIIILVALLSPFTGSTLLTFTANEYAWYMKPIAFMYPSIELTSFAPFPKLLLFSSATVAGFCISVLALALVGSLLAVYEKWTA